MTDTTHPDNLPEITPTSGTPVSRTSTGIGELSGEIIRHRTNQQTQSTHNPSTSERIITQQQLPNAAPATTQPQHRPFPVTKLRCPQSQNISDEAVHSTIGKQARPPSDNIQSCPEERQEPHHGITGRRSNAPPPAPHGTPGRRDTAPPPAPTQVTLGPAEDVLPVPPAGGERVHLLPARSDPASRPVCELPAQSGTAPRPGAVTPSGPARSHAIDPKQHPGPPSAPSRECHAAATSNHTPQLHQHLFHPLLPPLGTTPVAWRRYYTHWLTYREKSIVDTIRRALAWQPAPRSAPVFQFEWSNNAAEHNFQVLQKANFNLQAIIQADPLSPLKPGSEWRPVHLLEPLFIGHHLWPNVKKQLTHGFRWPLQPLPETTRQTIVQAALQYGNHKSSRQSSSEQLPSLKSEASKGWQLPLPVLRLTQIPGLEVAPLGYAHQFGLDTDTGKRVAKGRTTHDQSFNPIPDLQLSVNNRLITDDLTPCEYGFVLSCQIHRVVALRLAFPLVPILNMKLDFKSAYRRQHLHGSTAKRCTVTTTGLEETPIALMSLRQTFGGAAGPPGFSDISTIITDLANALARLPPDLLDSLPESIYKDKIGAPRFEAHGTPFAAALPLRVVPEADGLMTANNYLDDIIGCFIELLRTDSDRAAKALMLAFEITSRPLVPDGEPLPRDDNMSLGKLFAEGTPSEIEQILGWIINTRLLEISLPDDKFKMWMADIDELLRPNRTVSQKQLEQVVGRLNHAANALPLARHFLSSIRAAQYRATAHRFTKLTAHEKHTLRFWKLLLTYIHSGVSLNLVTLRSPNQIVVTDACTYGLGGFSCNSGRAWHFYIPPWLQHRRQINFLEFLACIIGQLLEIFEGRAKPGDCFLGRGDNTSAIGWLESSNFDPNDQVAHAGLARYYAGSIVANELCAYSEWHAGRLNSAADDLSRRFNLNDHHLTQRISSKFGNQVPKNFHLSPLPPEIESAALAVQPSTHATADRAWSRWVHFLSLLGITSDPLLRGWSELARLRLFAAFAQAIRDGYYSKPRKEDARHICADSCKSTLHYVAQAFTHEGIPDPLTDPHTGKPHLYIARILRGYANTDPGTKHQLAIPFAILKQLVQQPTFTKTAQVFQQLMLLAFFFALRSCEYLKVGPNDPYVQPSRRTFPLRKRNVRFWRNHRIVPHTDPFLPNSDAVTLDFEFQKRDVRDESVTQSSTSHPVFCPVKAAAARIQHMQLDVDRGLLTNDSFLYEFIEADGKKGTLTGKLALQMLRAFIASIDYKSYGMTLTRIGLHSLRASAAMALFLGGVSPYIIMLLGRWASDAFMRYLRKQVEEFNLNLSNIMIENPEYHYVSQQGHPRSAHSAPLQHHHGIRLSGEAIQSAFAVWPSQP